ncbi:MAG: Hint domain-containing protein, partial [Pseudomonadota bacterium]
PLSVGDGTVSIGNLNTVGGPNLFNLNTADQFNTEMDGFTVSLSLIVPVEEGQVNNLRIGIADVGDSAFDSNILIAADSLQSSLIANQDDVLLRPGDSQEVDVLANDINNTGGMIFITHINDVEVDPGDSVTLTTGQTITLTTDGTLSLFGNDVSEDVAFTYEISSTTGETSVGLIVVDTVPCFVAGSLIRTKRGSVPVEQLQPGDLVYTRDDGYQPVRWIGRREMPAEGKMAPVRIGRNSFGEHGDVMVSPLHRIFLQNSHAELLYGSSEVLVAARDLVDGKRVQQIEGGRVEYVHLMFSRHQVIWSDGLPSESFLPGSQTQNCFEQSALEEICEIFPELDPITGEGYGPAARPALKRFEARLLVA